jgi:hypothetical protein
MKAGTASLALFYRTVRDYFVMDTEIGGTALEELTRYVALLLFFGVLSQHQQRGAKSWSRPKEPNGCSC